MGLPTTTVREDYAREAEARIYTELQAANAAAPGNGATTRTSTGTALAADVRKTILAFPNQRGQKARSVVASSRTAVAEALETLDMDHFALRDVSVELSPAIVGVGATDSDVFVLGRDLYSWSSPLLELSYSEKRGPEIIEINLFGYFATRLIAPRGLANIRHT